jgi:hypothetical protein
MAIQRIRIDYTVYPPDFKPGKSPCWDFRTFTKAKRKAKGLGNGARVYRNFNQTNKRGQPLGNWWVVNTSGAGQEANSRGSGRPVSRWARPTAQNNTDLPGITALLREFRSHSRGLWKNLGSPGQMLPGRPELEKKACRVLGQSRLI